MTDVKWLLYTPGGPTVTRILPELAVEIGLNESIVLMQISFWIGQSNNLRDGCYWTYQSLRQMREKAFPYWSIETIRRTIESLSKKGYIRIGNYNKIESDKTQWFTLDPEMCSRLRSVLCAPVADEGVSKCDRVSQNETGVSQNETTLPEITPENTQNKKPSSRKRDALFDAIAEVWNTQAGGYVGQMKAMLLGKSRTGEWKSCNFDPPVTAEEVLAFGAWWKRTNPTLSIPTTPETIQRRFYEFRTEMTKKAAAKIIPIVSSVPVVPILLQRQQEAETALREAQ